MPLSMYQASVPIFTQVLAALGNVMGKAETAVRVQLHRARSRMAEMLRESGLDPGEVE